MEKLQSWWLVAGEWWLVSGGWWLVIGGGGSLARTSAMCEKQTDNDSGRLPFHWNRKK
ncbi:MAG: hypothetical protein U0793_02370 [Gemmataceae bacterium]